MTRANAAYPERSAIFLTPGDAREDGWLQPHEIAALDLRGAVVVLSACDSAEGSLIPGEGPLSLARAFSQAAQVPSSPHAGHFETMTPRA